MSARPYVLPRCRRVLVAWRSTDQPRPRTVGRVDNDLERCSFCGGRRAPDELVQGLECSICTTCASRAVEVFGSRESRESWTNESGSVRTGSAPCEICGGGDVDSVGIAGHVI